MKYAIIAAGDGSRLAQEGVTDSKPLVKVNGERLIDRLIRVFVANDATDILVICNEHMTDVARHLVEVEEQGLNGHHVPLQFLIKSTPSSMHSLYELRKYLLDEPFILTTVDTIFDEQAFSSYVSTFRERLHKGVDALMGVTDYIDDEKPLYVSTDPQLHVTGYYDNVQSDTQYVSAGIYGLAPSTLSILDDCIAKGQHRMRNFQRALVAGGLCVEAYPLSKVFDIDHTSDIKKAEEYLKKKALTMLLIQRARRYSPHSEEKDWAILTEVGKLLGAEEVVSEDSFDTFLHSIQLLNTSLSKGNLSTDKPLVLSMGRAPQTLNYLSTLEEKGVCVLNPTAGVRACQRSNIERVMRENHLPLPPSEGEKGYWLKRGDQSAETQEDVCYCANRAELNLAKECFRRRGIVDFIVQAHVEGDLIKFYGVEGTNFFRCFYPCDDGETKFGAELQNGISHHFSYSKEQLQHDAEQLSRLLQTPIYGGDAIIRADGTYVIIDFNDWPSYSRCRQEAAQAIVERVRQL